MREMRCRDVDLHTMNAGISNVIYMELYSGPKMANGRCGKTIDTGTIDRGSTVLILHFDTLPELYGPQLVENRNHLHP